MAQNRTKIEFNPLTGQFDLVNDLELGWTVKNVAKAPFVVKAGFTRVYPNLSIPVGMDIEVQLDGELIVF